VTAALAAVALAACAPRAPARALPRTAGATTAQIEAIVRQALAADAAADRAADTLYAPEAIVLANARVRLAAPRFAGVGLGGRVTVAAATVTLQGRMAWGVVDYRWFNVAERQADAGRATFVLEQRSAGWRITHVHSSQALPWDR
jgi:hypothetical protein